MLAKFEFPEHRPAPRVCNQLQITPAGAPTAGAAGAGGGARGSAGAHDAAARAPFPAGRNLFLTTFARSSACARQILELLEHRPAPRVCNQLRITSAGAPTAGALLAPGAAPAAQQVHGGAGALPSGCNLFLTTFARSAPVARQILELLEHRPAPRVCNQLRITR